LNEAQAALPGTRLNETGDALERVFLGLDMQRMFLKRNQQIQKRSSS
jgi:hypothetical protein